MPAVHHDSVLLRLLALHLLDVLHLPDLPLPDVVVAVRYQVFPHLRQRVGYPGVSLGRGGKGCYFNVKLLLKVAVFGVARIS